MKTLYWIFPCYNEEACLPNSFSAISETFNNFVEEELISKKIKPGPSLKNYLIKKKELLVLSYPAIKVINTLLKQVSVTLMKRKRTLPLRWMSIYKTISL